MIPVIADAGVPMLAIEWPFMMLALVPVIMVEILVAQKYYDIPQKKSWAAITTANLFSTMIGFPLMWGLMLGLQLLLGGGRAYGLNSFWTILYAVVVQAPWLIPYEEELDWIITCAGAFLMIPAFFASVYSERWVCGWFWKDVPKDRRISFSWRSNLYSYAMLLAIWFGMIAILEKLAGSH